MKRQVSVFIVISLAVIGCCACKNPVEESKEINQTGVSLSEVDTVSIDSNLQDEIREYMNLFMAEYTSDGDMEIDNRSLWGYSTEGGEITRYRDSSGNAIRYRMIYYGEMGKEEENYYFLSEDIFYTRLVENYSSPINTKIPTDILNREFEQGLLRSDTITTSFRSRKEIEDVFELAGVEAERDLHFSDYRILVINGYLLGGYYDDRWVGWKELYPMMPVDDTYKIYIKGQYRGAAPGRKQPETKEERYSGPWIDFQNSEYGFDGYNPVVAYSGLEDLQIESGTFISLDNKIYINELQKYLLKTGFEEEFEMTNIVKIDLDDDGQDEVFVQAYHHEDSTSESTGIQYMRKVLDGKVETFTIPIMAPTVSADHLTVIGFCDINGDGTKELLISAMGIGYHNYMVYEFTNDGFARVLENGGEH